jgi:hypothetical protein
MPFKVVIEPRALADIQAGIDYYEEQLEGLVFRFYSSLRCGVTAAIPNARHLLS